MAQQDFAVRVGTTLKVVSLVATLLIAGLVVMLYFLPDKIPYYRTFLALLLITMIPASLAFTVRAYRIDGHTLYIRRLMHVTCIDLRGLRSVEVLPKVFAGSVRVFGNGGFFSFSGWFWKPGLGRFKAYAMDLGPGLLLRWDHRAAALTPVDTQAMAAALRERVASATHSTD